MNFFTVNLKAKKLIIIIARNTNTLNAPDCSNVSGSVIDPEIAPTIPTANPTRNKPANVITADNAHAIK